MKEIDNSRLHREVDVNKRRECFHLLALATLVFLLGFVYAWQHFQCVRYSYQIQQLQDQKKALEEANAKLRSERAELQDPRRIDAMALELGLTPPDPRQVISVDGAAGSPVRTGDPEFARNVPAPALVPGASAREP